MADHDFTVDVRFGLRYGRFFVSIDRSERYVPAPEVLKLAKRVSPEAEAQVRTAITAMAQVAADRVESSRKHAEDSAASAVRAQQEAVVAQDLADRYGVPS